VAPKTIIVVVSSDLARRRREHRTSERILKRFPFVNPGHRSWGALGAITGLSLFVMVLTLVVALRIPTCPLALLFHVPCPMCGGTRAVRALLSMDPSTALRLNPTAPVVLLLTLCLAARGARLHAIEGHTKHLLEGSGRVLARALAAVFVVAILVWALRFLGLFGGPCPV
jgi:Protein of unknown function (DUF2752)